MAEINVKKQQRNIELTLTLSIFELGLVPYIASIRISQDF